MKQRAQAALWGLALGDALGMPTQAMSPEEISRFYGSITGLNDTVAEQPYAPCMPAGSVTDDTEQALLVAELLIKGQGRINPMLFATTLLAWEDDMRARGSLDLLGPSTKMALEKVREGADPTQTGRFGTTNGAAMRVTPIGVAFPLKNPETFAQAVHESCMVTHDTRQGWEGAGLVAAAVSAGIDGANVAEAIAVAIDTMKNLPLRGYWTPQASVVARVEHALEQSREIARRLPACESSKDLQAHSPYSLENKKELRSYLRNIVGTSVESTESLAAAFVVADYFSHSPYEGLCYAAELGGDTDTIAAIAGAIMGACCAMEAFPPEAIQKIREVSKLPIESLSENLLLLRKKEY